MSIGGVNTNGIPEANRLVVSDSVSQFINVIEFSKDICVIIPLLSWRFRFVRKNFQQYLAGKEELNIVVHIFPYTELHFRNKFCVWICPATHQTVICLLNDLSGLFSSLVTIQCSTRENQVSEPVVAKISTRNKINLWCYQNFYSCRWVKILLGIL